MKVANQDGRLVHVLAGGVVDVATARSSPATTSPP
jgi:hypothetical protein